MHAHDDHPDDPTQEDLARITPEDLAVLRAAKRRLESPSLAIELSSLVGHPLESGFKLLPQRFSRRIESISQAALIHAMDVAVNSLGNSSIPLPDSGGDAAGPGKRRWDTEQMHRWLGAGAGAAGGAFGLWALAVELPFSTTLMLRSIATIARAEGQDLSRLDVRLACLEVFALGGSTAQDDAAESSYWLIRGALGKAFTDAAAYIARRGIVSESAPPLVRFAASIASRFSASLSATAAAKAVPFVSAASGASINYLFMQHFQTMAHGHFTIRRLEEKYGQSSIRAVYQQLAI